MNEAAKTSRNTGVHADTTETASSTTGQPQVAVNTSATNGNDTDTGANAAPSLPGQSKHGDGGGGGGGGTAGAISIPVLLVLAFALIAAFYHRRKRQQHGAEAAAMAAAAAAVSVDNPAFAPPAGVARRAGVVVVGNNQQAYVVPMAGEDEGVGEEKLNEATRATAASSAVAEAAYVAPSRSQAVAYELGQVPGARDHPRASPNINQVYEPPIPPPPPVATASGPNYEDVDEAAHTGPSPTQPGDAEYAVVDEGGQQQQCQQPRLPQQPQQPVLDGDGYVEGGSLPTAASSNSGLAVYAQPSASATVYGESSSSA